jgi:protein phosphatase
MTRLRSYGITDIGRRRKHNEDAFGLDEALGVFVVADGLGGHAAGEVASNEAVEVIVNWIRREYDPLRRVATTPGDEDALVDARRVVERAVMAATYHVFSIAEYDVDKAGMGTTTSVLAIAGRTAVTAQVGDSRIYLVRNGIATQLTDDHTLIAMQLRDGLITPEEAVTAPHRNVITRAVGSHEYVEVDTGAYPVAPGDRFLVCTDGLHGYLSDDEIVSYLADAPETAAKRLVELANQRGGRDNITAIVVNILR